MSSSWKPRHGQLCQGLFAYLMNERKEAGTYIDVGCRDPYRTNNTWFLEKTLGWTGISIDIVDYSSTWMDRTSTFVQMDALTGDFDSLYKKHEIPTVVDYLTHDLEGNGDRYKGLIRMPFDDHEYKVITIEHDAYRGYDLTERQPQREFLQKRGYLLVAADVRSHAGDVQEDWWVHPNHISSDLYGPFISESQKFKHIFKFAGYDIEKLYDLQE